MGLLSRTGLLAAVPNKNARLSVEKPDIKSLLQDQVCVSPAPFILKPYAALYNPFSRNCSVLCNHPTDHDMRDHFKKTKDALTFENNCEFASSDMLRLQALYGSGDRDKLKLEITDDMYRRYAETDSRPLTPAPTLMSGKSKGSRRCLTPDQPHQRTAIVVDLRRSHSQETIHYHGFTTSDLTVGGRTSGTAERSTLPSLNISSTTSGKVKKQSKQLPPLASPLVLSQRCMPQKVSDALQNVRKNQLKALNLSKNAKSKKSDASKTKSEKETNESPSNNMDHGDENVADGEIKRRGKRRRKGRVPSDRLTSAGLAAQTQPDPETQIADIETDSQNPSSRGSITQAKEANAPSPTKTRATAIKKRSSFLDDDILKYLHRDVDEEAIQTEFDNKRRYVLQEALRTRPDRPYGNEMQTFLKEYKIPEMTLGDWLHIPRVFSRQNSQFTLPIDSSILEHLTPMAYATRYVTIKKSKQLLYLTVLRKFRPGGYRMPVQDIEQGLVLMMGGILTEDQTRQFKEIMEWDQCNDMDEESYTDDIFKLKMKTTPRVSEPTAGTIKYQTWCGLCAICERMYGRFPPREKDLPDGIELSDFTLLETKMPSMNIHPGLAEVLNVIRTQ